MKKTALLLAAVLVISVGFLAFALQQDSISLPVDEASSPWPGLEGAQNARQLGGYPMQNGDTVKDNVLFRSGQLSGLTDPDIKTLADGYHVAHVIDLRDEVEVEEAPDRKINGLQYHHFNVWPRAVRIRNIEESTVGGVLDSDLYIKTYYTVFALEPAAIEAYRQMFEVLLENEDGGILIHCSHGKDRTGVAVTLILSALGVDRDSIEQEYLLSNVSLPGSVDIFSLRFYLGIIEGAYGSMESYLETEMGLDEADLRILREKYTG